ncbi:MAG: carboxypeptidase regulatory-like domain-containing protein [bacterium]
MLKNSGYCKNVSGFSLIEVVVSLVLLAIIMLGYVVVTKVVSESSVFNKAKTNAMNMAEREIEDLISIKNYALLKVSTATLTIPESGYSSYIYDPSLAKISYSYGKRFKIYPLIERIDMTTRERAADQTQDTGIKRLSAHIFWEDGKKLRHYFSSVIVENPHNVTCGTINGNIVDTVTTNPVAGVRVSIKNQPFSEAYSDNLGDYVIECESGEVDLIAERRGYIKNTIENIDVQSASSVIQDIQLTPIGSGIAEGPSPYIPVPDHLVISAIYYEVYEDPAVDDKPIKYNIDVVELFNPTPDPVQLYSAGTPLFTLNAFYDDGAGTVINYDYVLSGLPSGDVFIDPMHYFLFMEGRNPSFNPVEWDKNVSPPVAIPEATMVYHPRDETISEYFFLPNQIVDFRFIYDIDGNGTMDEVIDSVFFDATFSSWPDDNYDFRWEHYFRKDRIERTAPPYGSVINDPDQNPIPTNYARCLDVDAPINYIPSLVNDTTINWTGMDWHSRIMLNYFWLHKHSDGPFPFNFINEGITKGWIRILDPLSDPVKAEDFLTPNWKIPNVAPGTWNVYIIGRCTTDYLWRKGYFRKSTTSNCNFENSIITVADGQTDYVLNPAGSEVVEYGMVELFDRSILWIKVTDTADVPLTGIIVLIRSSAEELQAKTSATGRCFFEVIRGQSYTVTANPGSFDPFYSEESNTVTSGSAIGEEVTASTLKLICSDGFFGFVKSYSGDPIPNVAVKAYDAGTTNVQATALTDSSGRFVIKGLPISSSFDIKAEPNWNLVTVMPQVQTVQSQSSMIGQMPKDFIIRDARITFTGRITNASGTPLDTGVLITASLVNISLPPEINQGELEYLGIPQPNMVYYPTCADGEGRFEIKVVYDPALEVAGSIPFFLYAWPIPIVTGANNRIDPDNLSNPLQISNSASAIEVNFVAN